MSRKIDLVTEGIPAREVLLTQRYNRNKKILGAILIFAVLLLYALFLFTPFYTILATSLTGTNELLNSESFVWWPQSVSLDGYKELFNYSADPDLSSGLLISFGNTIGIALLTSISSLFFSGMAAFAYSKIKFKGRNVLFFVELCTMMIPVATLTMPSLIFFNAIGWTQGWKSYLPVVVPSLFGGATMIFFLRSYMTSIPDEIVEAAKIDGLSPFKTYIKIMIPEAIPAFIAQFIFSFVASYNSYLKPLLYLSDDPSHYTLQVFLNEFSSANKGSYNYLCAAALAALIPLIIIFIICQKFFIEGVSVGGGKE